MRRWWVILNADGVVEEVKEKMSPSWKFPPVNHISSRRYVVTALDELSAIARVLTYIKEEKVNG